MARFTFAGCLRRDGRSFLPEYGDAEGLQVAVRARSKGFGRPWMCSVAPKFRFAVMPNVDGKDDDGASNKESNHVVGMAALKQCVVGVPRLVHIFEAR